MKEAIVSALMLDASSKIELAKINIEVYLNNSVGVGDHPNITETIQEQLDIISKHKDRLNVLMEYYYEDT
jgi:uncharacterized protein (DUF342 family)